MKTVQIQSDKNLIIYFEKNNECLYITITYGIFYCFY